MTSVQNDGKISYYHIFLLQEESVSTTKPAIQGMYHVFLHVHMYTCTCKAMINSLIQCPMLCLLIIIN